MGNKPSTKTEVAPDDLPKPNAVEPQPVEDQGEVEMPEEIHDDAAIVHAPAGDDVDVLGQPGALPESNEVAANDMDLTPHGTLVAAAASVPDEVVEALHEGNIDILATSEYSADTPTALASNGPTPNNMALQVNAEVETKKGSSSPTAPSNSKCAKCQKRKAADGCHQASCLGCCQDLTCRPHKQPRSYAAWKAQVLEGTTPIQLRAAKLRASRIPVKGRFVKEPGFVHVGDTVMIWNVRDYLANPRWKEDAIRKSLRRQERNETVNSVKAPKKLGNSRRRFRQFIQKRLEEGLMQDL